MSVYMRILLSMLLCIALSFAAGPAIAQTDEDAIPPEEEVEALAEAVEPEEEEKKELNFAGVPYAYTGIDTGFGLGFSIMFRDLFGQEGRDMTFTVNYTESLYQTYSVDWGEPYFLSDNGRLKIGLGYENKPVMRYFPVGNDSDWRDQARFAQTSTKIDPQYVYRFPRQDWGVVGVQGGWLFKFTDLDASEIENPGTGSFGRPIDEVFPKMFYSDSFDPGWVMGPNVSVYHDGRVDRFPLGGGREEVVWPMRGTYESVSYAKYDEAWGSDYNFESMSGDFRVYFPLYFEDTILVGQALINITAGNTPFYELPTHGLRGYYGDRFKDEAATKFSVELRQGFLPESKLELFDGRIVAKYPSIAIFLAESRVYGSYQDIPDEWLEDYHYDWGVGFRFIVTPSVVIKAELAWSEEMSTTTVGAGLPF